MHFSRIFSFVLFLLPCAICTDIRSLFGPSLSSSAQIFLPSDAEYTVNVTQRWDKFAEPQYIGAIKPASEQDIQNIVRIHLYHSAQAFPQTLTAKIDQNCGKEQDSIPFHRRWSWNVNNPKSSS